MCGIAGLIGFSAGNGTMKRMLSTMVHRGPDGSGIWSDGKMVELGHRRLSIIDLSTGAQPQVSPDNRFVITFNGEIYNYVELRPELERDGWHFRTTSDTEVLLAGLTMHGAEFLSRTVGMFAFALWDTKEQTLLLARDRIGVKPLYYAAPAMGKIVFASELKAMLCVEDIHREINPDALDSYLALRYVPGPSTMIKGIFKFPAGHWAIYKNGRLEFTRYWDINFNSFNTDLEGEDDITLEEQFLDKLRESVQLRMRSDVPFGAFLSGGVDSATIVGLMSQLGTQPVRTYSIGFDMPHSELDAAEKIAGYFGTEHTAISLVPDDLRCLQDVAWFMDEPYADPIVLAMMRLAQRASGDVKVILTGEGADELLSGYVHHPHLIMMERLASHLPVSFIKGASNLVKAMPMVAIDYLFNYPASPGEKGRERLSGLLKVADNEIDRYLAYISLFTSSDRRKLYTDEFIGTLAKNRPLHELVQSVMKPGNGRKAIDKILDFEYRIWLPDNILFKQDKTLMAYSVEGRVPFCDHRLVEFAACLPMRLKTGKKRNKEILRRVAGKLIPPEILTQQKKAFMVPLDGAYGAVLREMISDMLLSSSFRERGIFRIEAVEDLVKEFSQSPFLVGKQLMSLVMLEFWLEKVLKF
ncbi:MAG: asparagine synthase (glutamine-hydrolyzing) [Nitrospirae bacterium]|nr:asparagine synthase (glutamine-hydrolyzing) [Nitrospirota bacterium]